MNLALTPAGHLIMTPSLDAVGSADAAYTVPSRAGDLEQAFAASQAAGIMVLAGGKSTPDWCCMAAPRCQNGKNLWTAHEQ